MGFFLHYIYSAIKKSGDKIVVTMIFPYFPNEKVVCFISLVILANKVGYLTIELFDIYLETEDGFRYIVLENGRRLVLSQDIILQDI